MGLIAREPLCARGGWSNTRFVSPVATNGRDSLDGCFPPPFTMTKDRSERLRRAEFEAVALPHLDHVYTSARYLVRDEHAAEDLVQETILRAYRFFHQFEAGTNCRAWLLTILRNTFRNQHRNERVEAQAIDIDDPAAIAEMAAAGNPGLDPEALLMAHSLDGTVAAALQRLPEAIRSVVVLVDLQDLTYEEAARVLACPVGTVRSRLSRGRGFIASRLARQAIRRNLATRNRPK